MALIADFDLELSSEDVLGRLMLGGRAFRARPAAVMVAGLLARLREEQLLRPQASYSCVALRHGTQAGFDPEAAGLFEPGRRLSQRSRAGFIVAAVWSLGPDVSRAIADGFRQRRALQALVLDEIASLLVFRLGEQLFARLRQQLAVQGLCVGRPQRPGDGVVTLGGIVALFGEMGAGKTHLVKGMVTVWGINPDSVGSPTFTIVNEYNGADFPVFHFDAYRISHPDAFIEMGFEDYFFGDGLCVVEWPENVAALLPPETLRIRLDHISPTERRFSLADSAH